MNYAGVKLKGIAGITSLASGLPQSAFSAPPLRGDSRASFGDPLGIGLQKTQAIPLPAGGVPAKLEMKAKFPTGNTHQKRKYPPYKQACGGHFHFRCSLFEASAFISRLAEGEGFEPPEALTSTVFKTAAIDHSAIPPGTKVI